MRAWPLALLLGCADPVEPVPMQGWLPWDGLGSCDADCALPSGPYGGEVGETLPLSLSWQGYRPGAATLSTLSAAELFDCDGTRRIHAVLFVTAQFGCAPCYEISVRLDEQMERWEGVHVAILLANDPAGAAPGAASAKLWQEELAITRLGIYADPAWSLVVGDSVGTPMLTLVDPRTMQVVQRFEGLPDELHVVDELAAANAACPGP